MYRSSLIAAALALAASAAVAAHPMKPEGKGPGKPPMSCCAKCAMCSKMKDAKAGGMAGKGGGMMAGMGGGMMGAKGAAPAGGAITMSFAPDGSVYAVRGDTIYKLDGGLNVMAQTRLGAAPAAGAPKADPHAGHH